MNFRTNTIFGIMLAIIGIAVMPDIARGDILLLKRDNNLPMINGLELQFGGILRPQYRNKMGPSDNHTFMQRGYDSGSYIHTSVDYYLNDDVHLLGYYEVGFDMFNELGSGSHYDHQKDTTFKRKLYAGVASNTYGTLTYGQQNSVYYSVIGAKTDIWDNDMHGQGSNNGINGNYDGSYRGKNLLKYTGDIGPVTLNLSWSAPVDDFYIKSDNVRYQRKSGGAIGADYHVAGDLTLSAAYSYTRANIVSRKRDRAANDSAGYSQQMTGIAAQWKPDNWVLAASGGLFKDFIPRHGQRVPDNYFEGTAPGWEYLAGYTFQLKNAVFKSFKPYVAGDGMRWDNYQTNHTYLGLATVLPFGFQIDLERTFSNTSDHQPDENWVRLWYKF
ncbi:porin [Sodalis sp. RH21]|uniref:porin n=1 Tax=unclassified Sodalis (in: enterobacteria) TaxID=2636512 RepID=UPI0039B49349